MITRITLISLVLFACQQPEQKPTSARSKQPVKKEANVMKAPTPSPLPLPSPMPNNQVEPTPGPNPNPTPVPTPNPIPGPVPQPLPTPQPQPMPTPQPQPQPMPTPQPMPMPTPQPQPMPMPTPMPTPMPQMPSLPNPTTKLGDCPGSPAINQLQKWTANEGSMSPLGNILTKVDGKTAAKVNFIGSDWHVVPVWLGNTFNFDADVSKYKGLTLTYKAAGDFYIQMRPGFAWDGGKKWGAKFVASPDTFVTVTVPFTEAAWPQIPGLSKPDYTFAKAASAVRGFVIVGKAPGEYIWKEMFIDGFTPPCR